MMNYEIGFSQIHGANVGFQYVYPGRIIHSRLYSHYEYSFSEDYYSNICAFFFVNTSQYLDCIVMTVNILFCLNFAKVISGIFLFQCVTEDIGYKLRFHLNTTLPEWSIWPLTTAISM